jgi:hypothetical protein
MTTASGMERDGECVDLSGLGVQLYFLRLMRRKLVWMHCQTTFLSDRFCQTVAGFLARDLGSDSLKYSMPHEAIINMVI